MYLYNYYDYSVIYYINGRMLSVTEVHALYGRFSCGWLRVRCAWRNTLRWEVGVASWARSLHVKQLGVTGVRVDCGLSSLTN